MQTVCTNWIATAGLALCAVFAAPGGAQDTTSVVGIVLDANTLRPIADATIEIEALARTTHTNARGAFTFERVPVGEYVIAARAIGFARFRTTVKVTGQGRTELPIRLPKMTGLDTVVVTSLAREPYVFMEAQALGLGSFVGADLLAKSGDRRLGDILTTVRSVGVIQGRGGRAYVYSKRNAPSLRNPPPNSAYGSRNKPGESVYYPEGTDASMGIIAACYARVYLDQQLLNPTTPAQPVNINEYFARDLVGIEFYAGPASVPPRLAGLNSNCGVVVLHTRRYVPP